MKRLLISVLFFAMLGGTARAAEITVPYQKVRPGEFLNVPIMIDKADNLAGVKLVINFDKDILKFKEGNTTPSTRSLMNVINDKVPGRLIVVMAGAKGISGKDLTLLVLTFEVKANMAAERSTKLDIVETQLMTDQLKEVKAVVNVKPFDIIP